MAIEVTPPRTMLELLRFRAESMFESGNRLITEFSEVYRAVQPDDTFVCASGDYAWKNLPSAGKQLQAQLLPRWNRFSCLIRVLIQDLPQNPKDTINSAFTDVECALMQENFMIWASKAHALQEFKNAIDTVNKVLAEYFGVATEESIAIPDTSALLANPQMESWLFEGVARFECVLTPTVLGELDDHKVNHKNPQVREKAEQIIRKIKEYRRRGPLLQGVSLVKGTVSLRSIAVEPDMSRTLPWFDPSNKDDRILASTIEVIRENMGCGVFIVTGDINMQNKAEFASIPFLEPPIPPAGVAPAGVTLPNAELL